MSQNKNGLVDAGESNFSQRTLWKTYFRGETFEFGQGSDHQIIKGKNQQFVFVNGRKQPSSLPRSQINGNKNRKAVTVDFSKRSKIKKHERS